MHHETIVAERSLGLSVQPLELAVVIPTFNEAANVSRLLERLTVALEGITWEAIFVDDNSPDETAEKVRAIGVSDPRVRVVHRIGRRGLSSAVVEGMLASCAPVLAVIDGDMQHDEAVLPQLLEAISSGKADVAIGTRYVEGGGVSDWDEGRHKLSQWATLIGQKALGVSVSDPMSGYFAVSREFMMTTIPNLSGIGFKILLDTIASAPTPPRVAEIPYVFRSREEGESKIGARVGLEYLALLADKTIGQYIPLRLMSFLVVGAIGLGVHLSILGLLIAFGLSFLVAQSIAVTSAMTFNFFLNNIFTYADRRLRGWKMVGGLLSFYAVCLLGGIANVGVGEWVNNSDGRWIVAGIAGAIVGAVWNFAASAVVTWRKA